MTGLSPHHGDICCHICVVKYMTTYIWPHISRHIYVSWHMICHICVMTYVTYELWHIMCYVTVLSLNGHIWRHYEIWWHRSIGADFTSGETGDILLMWNLISWSVDIWYRRIIIDYSLDDFILFKRLSKYFQVILDCSKVSDYDWYYCHLDVLLLFFSFDIGYHSHLRTFWSLYHKIQSWSSVCIL